MLSRYVKAGLTFILSSLAAGIIYDVWENFKGSLPSFGTGQISLPIPLHWLIVIVIMSLGLVLILYGTIIRPNPQTSKAGTEKAIPNPVPLDSRMVAELSEHKTLKAWGVDVHLFFPWYYPRSKRDLKHIPHEKLIINWKTRDAYYMGAIELSLLTKGHVEWFSETKPLTFSLDRWAFRNRLRLKKRTPSTITELMTGSLNDD